MRRRIENKDSVLLFLAPIVGVALTAMLLFHFNLHHRNSWGFSFSNLEQDLRGEIRWLEDYGETLWINDSLKLLVVEKRGKIKRASSKDLLQLIGYKDGYIKALAFEGLCERRDKHLYESVMSILDDTSSYVEAPLGHSTYPTPIGEYCVVNVLSMQIPNAPPPPKPKYKLDKLFSKNELGLIAAKYQTNKDNLIKPNFY
ncbi:MAG: hypothetical protein GC192_14375 [Bacteroidetes bacterium]|nr:hypothetical protein [Bacteroidota bacterium]